MILADILKNFKGDAAFKSSYLYEIIPVSNKNGYFIKETETFGYIVV